MNEEKRLLLRTSYSPKNLNCYLAKQKKYYIS